jgi:ribosomal protein S18 acetylase RimI-like enzyme
MLSVERCCEPKILAGSFNMSKNVDASSGKSDEFARIVRATAADQESILALLPRLLEFGPPPWRDVGRMNLTDRKVMSAALASEADDPVVMIAVLKERTVVGFIHMHSVIDYYTERKNGHVADIVVDDAYQGQGIGRRLLQCAEAWARAQSYDWLTISVFPQNFRAVRTYEKNGFEPDIARFLKVLR